MNVMACTLHMCFSVLINILVHVQALQYLCFMSVTCCIVMGAV